MKTSLLLVAHGSRRAASNDEVRNLTQNLAALAGERFHSVDCAFLELAEPLIPDGIEQAIQQGAEAVYILPYFLSAGRHVSQDIPAEAAPKQQQYPQVEIKILPYLGSAEGIVELLLKLSQH